MSLEARILEDMKTAMKAKDQVTLEAVRAIKAAILLAKTETGAKDALSADDELKLLQRLKKQRVESSTIFREQNRPELAEVEEAQAAVIDRYLPEQMSEDEVRKVVSETIAKTGAAGPKDMGKVMGSVNKELAGRADGKLIANIVKEALNQMA